jgi:hypothetical protein
MKIKLIIVLVILLNGFNTLCAQSTRVRTPKIVVEGGFQLGMSAFLRNNQAKDRDGSDYKRNSFFKPWLSIEFATSKRISIGFDYTNRMAVFGIPGWIHPKDVKFINPDELNTVNSASEKFLQERSFNTFYDRYGIRMNFYPKSNIGPLGSYVSVQLNYGKANFGIHNFRGVNQKLVKEDISLNIYGFLLAFGSRKIILPNHPLFIGYRIGLELNFNDSEYWNGNLGGNYTTNGIFLSDINRTNVVHYQMSLGYML